jgi:RNA polymerase sigma factor (sigma-70 family)
MNSPEHISEAAFAALMREHYGALHRYGQHITQDKALLADCIQDVFVVLWQNRQKLPQIEHPRQYLLTALKRRIIRVADRDRRTAAGPAPEFSLDFSVEDLIVERQLAEQNALKLRQVLDQLPARQKEVIYLVYYQQLDPSEVAELMNIHRQSVYNLLSETIRKIRDFWLESAMVLLLGAFV